MKMLKTLGNAFAAVILSFIVSSTFAGSIETPVTANPFNGFFITGSGGLTHLSAEMNHNGELIVPSFPPIFTNTIFLRDPFLDDAGIGNLGLGFGYAFGQRFYLGAAISASFFNLKDLDRFKESTNTTNINRAITYFLSLGNVAGNADLRIGFLTAPTNLLYAIIGWTVARSKLSVNDAERVFNTSDLLLTQTKTLNGWRVGLGFEQWLMRRLTLHLSYIYSKFQKITINGESAPNANGDRIAGNVSVQPKTYTFLLGLSYYLNGANQAAAAIPQDIGKAFCGWFIRFGVGFIQFAARLNEAVSAFDGGTGGATTMNSQQGVSQSGAAGELAFGGGLTAQRLYLGADLFVNVGDRESKTRISNDVTNFNFIIKSNGKLKLNCFEFGADITPGFIVGPTTLLYARIGVALNRAKIKSDIIFNATAPGGQITVAKESKKDLTGLRLGTGLHQAITRHLELALDYIYTCYGKHALKISRRFLNVNNFFDSANITIRSINTQTALLSIIYRFR